MARSTHLTPSGILGSPDLRTPDGEVANRTPSAPSISMAVSPMDSRVRRVCRGCRLARRLRGRAGGGG